MNDVLLNTENFDLGIKDGDFDIGISDQQQQALLLMLDKGSLKQFPTAGVGSARFIEAENPAEFFREIRQQFIEDGMEVKSIGFNADGNLKIDAQYK